MILTQDIRDRLSEIFSERKDPNKRIEIVFFKENLNCSTCNDVEMLLNELKDALGFIDLHIYNKHIDNEKTAEYNVAMTPAIFFKKDNVIKNLVIYGMPSGYEFITLIEIIKYLSEFEIELEENTIKELGFLSKDADIKVFVTPTCPYCPHAAVTAAKLALSSDKIKTQIIVVNEFPDLALNYSVRGVPKIVINNRIHLEGARPESDFIEAIKG